VVYDAARHRWFPNPDGFSEVFLGDILAVGRTSRGRLRMYDRIAGEWKTPEVTCARIQVADYLAVFYGERSETALYDAQRGKWRRDKGPYSKCALENRMALFWGPPATGALLYDGERDEFLALREPLAEGSVFGGLAAGLGPKGKAFAYAGGKWVPFPGSAQLASIEGGQVQITDAVGETWVFAPETQEFLAMRAPNAYQPPGEEAPPQEDYSEPSSEEAPSQTPYNYP